MNAFDGHAFAGGEFTVHAVVTASDPLVAQREWITNEGLVVRAVDEIEVRAAKSVGDRSDSTCPSRTVGMDTCSSPMMPGECTTSALTEGDRPSGPW